MISETAIAADAFIEAVVVAAKEAVRITPVVGEGATVFLYSDRQAFTVIAVSATGKTATLRRDTATLLNGHGSGASDVLEFSSGGFCGHTSGIQRYSYAPNPEGEVVVARLTRKGWASEHRSVVFGKRSENYDFNS